MRPHGPQGVFNLLQNLFTYLLSYLGRREFLRSREMIYLYRGFVV